MNKKELLLSYIAGISNHEFDELDNIVTYENVNEKLHNQINSFIDAIKLIMQDTWKIKMMIYEEKSNTRIVLPIISK